MKIKMLIVIACCGLLFVGCSGKTVEYETEKDGINDNAGGMVYEADSLEQFSDLDSYHEDFDIPCDKYRNYKIDAKINIPKGKYMSVFEVKEAFTKQSEWDETCSSLFDEYNEDKNTAIIDYCYHAENFNDSFNIDGKYAGEYKGRKYLISKVLDACTVSGDLMHANELIFQPMNLREFVPDEIKDTSKISINLVNKASGDYSKEQKEAEDFLSKLKMENYELMYAYTFGWYDDSTENSDLITEEDGGYVFCFQIQANDSLPITADNYAFDVVTRVDKQINLYDPSTAMVYVNKYGIVYSLIQNPLQEKNTLSKVNLLPFDKIIGALKTILKDNSEILKTPVITKATLTYTYIVSSESKDEFSFVPAWHFETYDGKIDINAVDGSLISYPYETD